MPTKTSVKDSAAASATAASAVAALATLDGSKQVGTAAASMKRALSVLDALEGEIAEGIAEDAEAFEEVKRKIEEEMSADIKRLENDTRAKDSKIIEIQSKFSFVLGTVTARSEVVRNEGK